MLLRFWTVVKIVSGRGKVLKVHNMRIVLTLLTLRTDIVVDQ